MSLAGVVGLVACTEGIDAASPTAPIVTAGELVLVREKKIAKVLDSDLDAFEASGIAIENGRALVVFDNMTRMASIALDLGIGTLGPGAVGASQYEAIAVDPEGALYVGIEAKEAVLAALDDDGTLVRTETTDLRFDEDNRALEGLALITADGTKTALVLCEAPGCGDAGVRTGRIRVLAQHGTTWTTTGALDLPAEAAFEDFSDLALRPAGDGSYDVAVVSQQNSAVWLGTLTTHPLALTSARVLAFPKELGVTRYCNVEGIAFLDRSTLVAVSDEGSGDCKSKSESIHVFTLP